MNTPEQAAREALARSFLGDEQYQTLCRKYGTEVVVTAFADGLDLINARQRIRKRVSWRARIRRYFSKKVKG